MSYDHIMSDSKSEVDSNQVIPHPNNLKVGDMVSTWMQKVKVSGKDNKSE